MPFATPFGRSLAVATLACALSAQDHDHLHHHDHGNLDAARPDGHAPIGVMGDHTHHAGEWMASLRAMRMHMEDFRDGTDRLTTDEVLDQGYMMAPVEMDMDMVMAGLMWAPSDRVTLMGMLPYVRKEMTVRMRMTMMMMTMEQEFETESSGLGDLKLGALVHLAEIGDSQQVHAGLGLSLPTGSITETDDTPMGDDVQLPYAMQLGSGTWDLLPSVTWLGQIEDWSWGAQASAVLRLGENDQAYTLGDRFQATGWGAWRSTDWLSASLRATWTSWGSIDGSDKDLPAMAPMMNPNADPDQTAGDRLDLGLGLNTLVTGGWAAGNRVALELSLPVFEDLEGPQMSTAWMAMLGWQYAF